jgi:hypothetical protein
VPPSWGGVLSSPPAEGVSVVAATPSLGASVDGASEDAVSPRVSESPHSASSSSGVEEDLGLDSGRAALQTWADPDAVRHMWFTHVPVLDGMYKKYTRHTHSTCNVLLMQVREVRVATRPGARRGDFPSRPPCDVVSVSVQSVLAAGSDSEDMYR